jgi:heme-degrading monooxygenase HmoA
VIGVLTHHWAKPDRINDAKALLERNGAAQSRFAGFGSRQTLFALNDATKITTLVTWVSSDVYDAWRASPERNVAMAGADELWAKPPESERFEIAS